MPLISLPDWSEASGARGSCPGVSQWKHSAKFKQDAHVYSEAVRRGGTLVTVRTDQSPERVQHILDAHEPIDPIARRKQYEESGWTGFDPDAAPYKPDEAETERMRRRI